VTSALLILNNILGEEVSIQRLIEPKTNIIPSNLKQVGYCKEIMLAKNETQTVELITY